MDRVMAAAVLASLLALGLLAPCSVSASEPLLPPGPGHPLGTDPVGRDAACMLIHGLASSIETGLAGLAVSLAVLAAAASSAVTRCSRLLEWLASTAAGMPRVALLALAAPAASLGPLEVGAAAGLLSSLQAIPAAVEAARRAAREPYVEAARALGASTPHLLARHILPAAWGALASGASMAAAASVYAEAGLAALGLTDPAAPSLGRVLGLVLETPGALLTAAGLLQAAAALALVAAAAWLMHSLVAPRGPGR